MFTFIDTWLLDSVFQKASDRFRDDYGKTPFWIAATCAYAQIGFALAENFLKEQTIFSIVLNTILIGFWLLIALMFDSKDKQEEHVLTRTMNSWRISPLIKFVRITTVIILILDVLIYGPALLDSTIAPLDASLELIQDVLFFAVYYFGSCSTKPPSLKPVEKPAAAPASAVSESA